MSATCATKLHTGHIQGQGSFISSKWLKCCECKVGQVSPHGYCCTDSSMPLRSTLRHSKCMILHWDSCEVGAFSFAHRLQIRKSWGLQLNDVVKLSFL